MLCASPLGVFQSRPLRFILTGEFLVLLFVVSPAARTAVQKGLDQLQPVPVNTSPPPSSPGEKVKDFAKQKSSDRLVSLLVRAGRPGGDGRR